LPPIPLDIDVEVDVATALSDLPSSELQAAAADRSAAVTVVVPNRRKAQALAITLLCPRGSAARATSARAYAIQHKITGRPARLQRQPAASAGCPKRITATSIVFIWFSP
jgi:type IV pilus biogenesis protein CpaD/CtpE